MQSCPNVYKLVFTVIRFFTVVPFLLLVVFTPTRALASINQTINFQGKLVDSSGLNVPDGTQYELTFKLYNVSSSGTAIWTEVQGNVSVTSGIFQVQLGSVTPLTQVDFNNSNLYLGITVSKNGTGGATGESEMTPRIQFTGVPYAFNAASLQGVVATQSATGFTLTGGYQNPKTLTLNDNITIGLTITPTSSNALTVKSNSANGLTLDTGGAAAIGIGASANAINIGNNTFANNTAVTITTGGSGIVTIGSNTGTGNILLQPNAGGQAALVVNDQGAGDIFTASAGALTKFTVANNGNISATGTLTGLTGVTLASGGITLGGTVGTGSQCLLSGATASWGSCGTGLWNLTSGALTPWYSTNDLLIGGTSTASADFAVLNVNSGIPTATVSGNLIVMPHNGGGGSLGIDTASPQYTLDVAGTTAAFNSGKNASLTSFSTNGTTLPATRDRGASVIANGYVYYFGGDSGSSGSPLTNVYYAPLNANGSINAWVSTTSLPDSGHNALTAVAANNYIYILGGNDGVGLSSDNYVYYAHINADGSLGAWIKNNYSMVTAVRGHTSVIANGYIYAIGGKDSFSTVKNTVQFAKIYPDGSTGPWTTTTNLPVALMYASSVVANNYLYVLGGYDGTNALTPVYYGKLNADGTISSWLTTNALPQADMASGAIVANGNVYVVGGATGTAGTVLNTIIYAPFNSNGSLGSWTTNGSTLPTAKTYIENSVVTANGYVYAIGGTTDAAGTVPASSIYYSSTARVSLAGDLDLLGFNSASLSAVSGDTGSSIYAGNIYSNNSLNVHGTTQLWDIFSANNGGVINNQLQISGGTNGGNALLVVNQQGASADDIFTASSSGTTKFTIANTGNITATGTITGLTGITLASGGITLGGTVGTGSQCLLGGSTASWGSCGSGISPFKEVTTNGTIVPFNNTEDFLIGGIATQGANFADFAFTNVNPGSGTPTASISAGVTGALLLDAGGNIQTTAKQVLTIGGGNSGNVILSPSGNVGIGGSPLVNSINFKLAIAGSAAITGANTLSFYQDTTTRNGTIGGGSSQFIFNAVNSSVFAFQVEGSEKMRLDTSGNLGIGATSPLATLDIRSNSITSPVASISGDTGKSTLIIDQRGIGDIFTASQSGGTRFTIGQNGNITDSNYAVAGGILYGTSTGLMQITGAGNSSQCLVGGAVPTWGSCATGTVVSPFKEVITNGIIVPLNATEDFLIGGTSTSSADFAFLNVAGGTPTASISAGVANSGRGLYITGTGTIATTANQNLVLGANTGISNVQVTPNAGGQAALIVNDQGVGDLFTASAAATTRFIVHNNGSLQLAGSTGSDITTITGGNGLTIAPKTNASGAGGGLILNAGNGTGGVGGNVSIDAGTGSANGTVSVGTANATSISLGNANTTITFGTGGNTVQFTTGAGLVYAGTARLNKTIVLSAEYAGAVLTASGSATTTGSMTSDASSSATLVSNGTNIWKTFYSWTSSTASPLQDYTVAVRVTLPQDFSDWQTNAITIDYDTMDVSAANNALDVYIYNPNATNKNVPVYFKTGNVVGNWDSWGTLTINKTGVEDTIDPDWATAGQSAVIYLKMRAMNNNHVLISDIKLNYLSKF